MNVISKLICYTGAGRLRAIGKQLLVNTLVTKSMHRLTPFKTKRDQTSEQQNYIYSIRYIRYISIRFKNAFFLNLISRNIP